MHSFFSHRGIRKYLPLTETWKQTHTHTHTHSHTHTNEKIKRETHIPNSRHITGKRSKHSCTGT